MKPVLGLVLMLASLWLGRAEEIIIPKVTQTPQGTMEISFQGKGGHYYKLYRSTNLQDLGEPVAMAIGHDGSVSIKDRLKLEFTQSFYRVQEIPKGASEDLDGDGLSDYDELKPSLFNKDIPDGNPWNPKIDILPADGIDHLTQGRLDRYAVLNGGAFNQGLDGTKFIKLIVLPLHQPSPAILFMNTRSHPGHGGFLTEISEYLETPLDPAWHCEIIQVPQKEGEALFVFSFQPGNLPRVEDVRLVYHLITKNAPFVDGNLAYRPLEDSLQLYRHEQEQFEAEGIPVWQEEEQLGLKEYQALNGGTSYGLLRVFNADERPSILDIAIYRQLPNDVPLLRGIITETPQTPLSHVNLRAVQNRNPNAFIREASLHPDIAPLIGTYVRFSVKPNGFEISESSLDEVNEKLATSRPKENQVPPRDLEEHRILPLHQVGFESSSSIGAKAANLAEMVSSAAQLNIPAATFPEIGYAVPFYYYDEFMKFNNFYSDARAMITSPSFLADPIGRDRALKAFRSTIKDAQMPTWMLEELSTIQSNFSSAGVAGIRCRSSTNNEDLPGFNGAGLYSSYTHHPDEGHLSKSVKQVFASLWSFLAFEHREFYRVDHFHAAMGVLMHPNYEDERANGVAVSTSGPWNAPNYFYANVQVGENLVTNPDISSRPEELLFNNIKAPVRVSSSNQLPLGQTILSDQDAILLSRYLIGILAHFRNLYGTEGESRHVEIEFKIDKDGNLVIKQARPWLKLR